MRKAKAKEVTPKENVPTPPPDTVDLDGPVIILTGPFGEPIVVVNTDVPRDEGDDREEGSPCH